VEVGAVGALAGAEPPFADPAFTARASTPGADVVGSITKDRSECDELLTTLEGLASTDTGDGATIGAAAEPTELGAEVSLADPRIESNTACVGLASAMVPTTGTSPTIPSRVPASGSTISPTVSTVRSAASTVVDSPVVDSTVVDSTAAVESAIECAAGATTLGAARSVVPTTSEADPPTALAASDATESTA
jgi:hypothetical protein